MWLLACVGVFVLVHSDRWWFIGLDGYDATTIGQIGAFYLGWTGAQLPAAGFAGMIIGSSDFPHPLRTTFWTASGYHLVLSAIRAARWPWRELPDLDQSIPVLLYVVSTLLLVGVSVSLAWLMPRWHKAFQRYFAH